MFMNEKREPSNEVDKYAVAIIRKDSWENESIVGHVPENISKCCSMLLTINNTAIKVQAMDWKSQLYTVFLMQKDW